MKEQRRVSYANVYHLSKYIENDVKSKWKIQEIESHISPLFDVVQFDIGDFNVRFEIRHFNAYNYRQIMRRITEVMIRNESIHNRN